MGYLKVQKTNEDSLKSIISVPNSGSNQSNNDTIRRESSHNIGSNITKCTCLRSQSSTSAASTLSSASVPPATDYQTDENNDRCDNTSKLYLFSCLPSMKIFILYLIAMFIYISTGAAIAWSSSVMRALVKNVEFVSPSTSWLISIFPISAAVAPIIVFKTKSWITLKAWVSIGTFFLTLFWTLRLIFVLEFPIDLILRTISGLGTGILLYSVPVYLSHFIKESSKSKMEQMMYGMLMFGALMQYLTTSSSDLLPIETVTAAAAVTLPTTTGIPMLEAQSTENIANGVLFPYTLFEFWLAITSLVTFIATLCLLPQSPQTLVHRQRYAEARQHLERYIKNDDDDVVAKMQCWAVKEKRDQNFMQIFTQKLWVERLVPVFGLIAFDALLAVVPMMFFLEVIVDATGGRLSTVIKILLFCSSSMIGCIYIPQFLRDRLSKTSLILTIALLFFTYTTLGTFYHLQNLAIEFVNDYTYTPVVCFTLLGFIYFGGIRQHMDFYTSSLTSRSNRLPIRALAHSLSWFIAASISHKLNHAIWYIGVGWIFYNIATVCLFFILFVTFVLPKVTKNVVVIDIDSDGSDVSSHVSTSRSSSTQTESDITMDAVLVA